MKHLHMTLALISLIGFAIRGPLAINKHTIMQQKWIRIVPHINDTLLLLAAIYLVWALQLNPLTQSWLAAKIIALVIYIILGARVIKTRGSKTLQWSTYVAGLAVFAYIGAVAVTKSPWLI